MKLYNIVIAIARYMLKLLPPSISLKMLFKAEDLLRVLIAKEAIRWGKGIHPKHWLTDYHRFFIENIADGESVLDIGCGAGELTYDIAVRARPRLVMGIDMNPKAIAVAKQRYEGKVHNLKFIVGKAPDDLPEMEFDVVVLSNVLEHQEDRISFLKSIIVKVKPRKALIRVPMFERDWRVPLRKVLSLNYFLDPTHYIEYTYSALYRELEAAGLTVKKLVVKWGEFYVVCEPKHAGRDAS